MTYWITPKGDVVDTEDCERAVECKCCGNMKPVDDTSTVHIDGQLEGSVCDECTRKGNVFIVRVNGSLRIEDGGITMR